VVEAAYKKDCSFFCYKPFLAQKKRVLALQNMMLRNELDNVNLDLPSTDSDLPLIDCVSN
jgi:hypothetical protein